MNVELLQLMSAALLSHLEEAPGAAGSAFASHFDEAIKGSSSEVECVLAPVSNCPPGI